MSPRTGRPKSDNPRNKSLNVRLTQDELDLLQECAEKLNKTKFFIYQCLIMPPEISPYIFFPPL